MNRRCQGEGGAALVLAIAFLVLMAGIGAAVVSSVTSGVTDRAVLDQVRNRQYAADGAIENDIAYLRTHGGTCGGQPQTHTLETPAVTVHVDCVPAPAVVVGPGGDLLAQNDIIFVACLTSDVNGSGNCPTSKTIINAQINFQGPSSPLTTYVQSWSVNG